MLLGWFSPILAVAEEVQKQETALNPIFQFVPMIAVGVLAWVILIAPSRREQRKRQQTLDGMKKNDRVVTIGGIIGTVAIMSDNGKEVVLKVEDNVRIRFTRSAIAQILNAEGVEEVAKK